MTADARKLGATVEAGGIGFAVWSGAASRIDVSIFDQAGEVETARIPLHRGGDGVFSAFAPGLPAGTRYGYRADGEYAPDQGLWFDPEKLLADPYALRIDRPYRYDPQLASRRGSGVDTAALMPKCVAMPSPLPVAGLPPVFAPGGLIYELPVRAFTMGHPDVPPEKRGTIAALAEPAVIEHLTKLGVSAIELMPVVAWIDERHLPPLGLSNAWGYNPVTFMALDPRLAPGGLAELRDTVAALRVAGIGVILDLVFNHTGESDEFGPTLSLRGLDARAYFRHVPGHPSRLVNDTGTGNTIDCQKPMMRRMILDTLRHFVRHAGVDGFRFDLAPILGRTAEGFDADAPLLRELLADPDLNDRVLIAEPWDVGAGGYQLGRFPAPFLEWNDRFRDDVRRFWRGDAGTVGALATRLAGSSDLFGSGPVTRSVNFVAAHDGMTLADTVRYERKHNDANGESNRDGHNENFSWNNGVEGDSPDKTVAEARRADVIAMLATLFASRGTIMLTAGDEFGRTQCGNNNAYAQDNEVTWLDWEGRDRMLEAAAFGLSALRRGQPALADTALLTGQGEPPDVQWL
ncbi:MAG: glycogen debranching protein GlgX, partial [Rhizobiaceae bacterium]|nr:glycogen debranching protein GlgX [Rhizobiaceae bacterium]